MKKMYMIVNPHGGLKKGLNILKKIKPIFKNSEIDLIIKETQYAGHAFDYSNSLDFEHMDAICAIGGDGTMYEIINGMLKRKDNKKLPIGLITGGTGNSFMHDLDCLDPLDAAKRIVSGRLRPVDIVKVSNKKTKDIIYSFNIVGWGLVTDVGLYAEKLRWLKGLRYDIAAIMEVMIRRNRFAKLVFDNNVVNSNFIFVIGCNTVHTGKAMKMAPDAILNDGKIDLIIVNTASRIELLKLFPKLFNGDHVKSPLVQYEKVKTFSIIPSKVSTLNIDGELIGATPLHVQVLEKKLNLLV